MHATESTRKLFKAIESENLEDVKEALRKGADINSNAGPYRCPPLSIACLRQSLEIAKTLLDSGADFDARFDGCTPLMSATRKYYFFINRNQDIPDMLKMLIKYALLQNSSFKMIEKPRCLDYLDADIKEYKKENPNKKFSLSDFVKLRENKITIGPSTDDPKLKDYWDKCRAENKTMREHSLGKVAESDISLFDFLVTKDDVKLVSYVRNEEISSNLENLTSNNYQEFPIYADFLSSKMTEVKEKSTLYSRIDELRLLPFHEEECLPYSRVEEVKNVLNVKRNMCSIS